VKNIMSGFSLIYCVVNAGDADKAMQAAQKYGVKGGTISLGKGTVPSHILALLGLDEVRKEIVTMVIENELASEAIRGISADMNFHKPNHGIAFSVPVGEFIGSKNIVQDETKTDKGNTAMYAIIFVVVDRGRADEVVDAANSAGARGATIINARGAGIHEDKKLFNMRIAPEKEEIFILATRELKDKVVESIRTSLKIDEPGNGILFVMGVNEVYGLRED